ncbi:cholinesterase 2-like isoform X2 [Haliotis rufescens]|uniref:cholinesterase 2-like isoform X2 n=1 Tax=Haliotis rufescens TaxID=6454 RepID=UPI00201F144D|nr:cholinesterase 2-like isoform X2 [Haliotis rufescens]
MAVIGVFTLLFTLQHLNAQPVVDAPWGAVEGTTNVTEDWTPYHAFLGIPYAVPPTGARRFKRPQPHPGFKHIFKAQTYGPPCIQILQLTGNNGVTGDEDCLTLNVFTPALLTETKNIPVIVWIHGGGFIVGDAFTFDPSLIVGAEQVIVVTIEYRLGPLGFLSTNDDVSKGNYGLWDQHLALEWVKKNIASFGGDINSITIMGESAGSASVAFQALYPGSKGLFQRTIMQSGSVSSAWAYTRNSLKYARELAHKVNCSPQNDTASMITCLRTIPAKTLTAASWPMGNEPVTASAEFYFVPTIDGEFVKDDPLVLINSPSFLEQVGLQNLDCMVSVVSNEGGLFSYLSQAVDKEFNSSISSSVQNKGFYINTFIPEILELYFGASSPDMTQAVAKVYLPPHSPAVDLQAVMNTLGDAGMVVPATLFARAHAKLTRHLKTGMKTYMYVFDHIPSFIPGHDKGMNHGEDLIYTFGLNKAYMAAMAKQFRNTTFVPDQSEKELSHTLMGLLTDFARYGDPNNAVRFGLNQTWPAFAEPGEHYLLLNTTMSVQSSPFKDRVKLWAQKLPRLLHALQNQHHTTNPNPQIIG